MRQYLNADAFKTSKSGNEITMSFKIFRKTKK